MSTQSKGETVPSILDFLFDPEAVVHRCEPTRLRTPAAIVVLTVVANLVGALLSVRWLAPALPGSDTMVYLLSAVTATLLPVTVWIGSGVAFYVIATLTFIDVDLRGTIWMTGSGMMPYLLSSLLGTAATVFAITQVPAPDSVQLVQARSSIIQSLAVVQFANLVHLMAVVWTGVNWTLMGASVWNVSTKRAVKIVCGPLVLLLIAFANMKLL